MGGERSAQSPDNNLTFGQLHLTPKSPLYRLELRGEGVGGEVNPKVTQNTYPKLRL